ncbi:MAG: hypothetical protein HFE97_07130 [Oscillospiraceae bacterium]|nr:hypothetical protein [Oscillospiraceae bacterium]
MEWSKIKNIILVILLSVNLILLSMVGCQEQQSAQNQRQARQSVLTLLEENGISMSESLWPEPVTLAALQVDGDGGGTIQKGQAATLLGPIQWVEDGAGGLRTTYYGLNGTAELTTSGWFTFRLNPGTVPLDLTDPIGQGQTILSRLGLETVWACTQEQNGVLEQSYWQCWDGTPVFNCRPTLTWENGFLSRVEGQHISGTAAVTEQISCLDLPTVFVHFLSGMIRDRYLCSEITAVTAGYETTFLTPPFQLTPVWNITTDTGEYHVNAATGAFSQALAVS